MGVDRTKYRVRIRMDAIVECWDDAVRTVASLDAGTVAPSVICAARLS